MKVFSQHRITQTAMFFYNIKHKMQEDAIILIVYHMRKYHKKRLAAKKREAELAKKNRRNFKKKNVNKNQSAQSSKKYIPLTPSSR